MTRRGFLRCRDIGCSLLALVVLSCDGDRSAGNSGTSTDNVIVAKFSVDSIAADQAPPDSGAYPLLLSLDGERFEFARALPGGSDLVVGYGDSTKLPFHIRAWSQKERFASLWVGLPAGDLWKWKTMVLRYGDGVSRRLSDSAATWRDVSEEMRQRLRSTLLADFEGGFPLRPLLPNQRTDWYFDWSPGTLVVRPAKGERLEPALTYDSARGSRVVHLEWKAAPTGWVLFGARLGTSAHRMNALDSIEFWAKGDGAIRVALEDRRDTTDLHKAWKRIEVDTAWKRYRVVPSDFDAPDSLNKGWNFVRANVTTFTIFGVEGTKLRVDDIRLHGVNPWELQ